MKHPHLLLFIALTACGTGGGASSPPPLPGDATDVAGEVVSPPAFTAAWADGAVSFRHDGRELARLVGVEYDTFTPRVHMLLGFFEHTKEDAATVVMTLGAPGEDHRIPLLVGTEDRGSLTWAAQGHGRLEVRVALSSSLGADGIRLRFAAPEGAAYWGFGEQYNFTDFKGLEVPIWTQEQGVGRAAEPALPMIGELTDTYFPMPWLLDPVHGYGFLLQDSEYSLFDLEAAEPGIWSVEVWRRDGATFSLYPGPTPRALVMQLTDHLGRPARRPPDWAFAGLWLAAQGGTAAVAQKVQTVLDAGATVTAVWSQDWIGQKDFGFGNLGVKYHWSHDPEHYPGLEAFISDLDAQGIRFLGYFNPFVLPEYEHWDEAVAGGYLITDVAEQPYLFPMINNEWSLPDLTRPAAREWFKGFARAATDMGQRGWMCDFGEYLPVDARLADGDAAARHNLYPTDWHRLSREVLEEAFPDGDYVLLTRSGFTHEHTVAQVVWAGDQEADWTETDGLPTVPRALLSLGLAGIPFATHDVGGFSGGPRTKELMLRWIEAGAFTPVMRTHEGLRKLENHQVDSDEETLAHLARFTQIHAALLPYLLTIADEAVETGLPMIRHVILVDPAWDGARDANAQWLIGDDLLFAPVVTEGAETVDVALPAGEWEHLLTGETYQGRSHETVDAPVGTPAVFVRVGALIDEVAAARGAAGIGDW
jgi:alpha-glucosidase